MAPHTDLHQDGGVLPPGEAHLAFGRQFSPGAWPRSMAMSGLVMRVRIQRLGWLDLISCTERTKPVTRYPSIVKVVFWKRCWS
jgi:hypothetical protein